MSSNSSYALQQLIYGETTVNIDENGLWNATALVQAYNKKHNKDKRLNNWLRTDYTKELISELEGVLKQRSADSPRANFEDLVKTIATDPLYGGGTWIHPKLVLPLAHWLSPKFYIWCNEQIEQLIIQQREQHEKALLESEKQLILLKPLQPLLQQPLLEKQVQKLLENSFGGSYGSYLKLESGIPDLVSEKFLIEIKDVSMWKHALGQLQAYRNELIERKEFDNRVCIAYLFDRNDWLTENRKTMITKQFNNFDFEVIWHSIIDEDNMLKQKHIEAQNLLQNFLDNRARREARYLCIAPDSTETYTSALKAYCKEHNLDYSSVIKCLKNILKSVKGYKFQYASEEAANESLRDKKKRAAEKEPIIAQNIEGTKTFIIKNVYEFIRQRNIKSPGNIYGVLNKVEVRGSIRQTAYGYRYWWAKTAPPEVVVQLELDIV